METTWVVALSIKNIKTRASREMTSRKNIKNFYFNGGNVRCQALECVRARYLPSLIALLLNVTLPITNSVDLSIVSGIRQVYIAIRNVGDYYNLCEQFCDRTICHNILNCKSRKMKVVLGFLCGGGRGGGGGGG